MTNKRRLPPLSALRAFEVVGRSSSLRGAASELQVTHTAVSQHMRELENWFGVPLIQTTRRGTTPTDIGLRLHAHVTAAFALLEQGVDEVRPPGPEDGKLTIWCAPGFAAHWILPRFKSLEQEFAGVEIVLRPTEAPADFSANEADIEIRYGLRVAPGLIAETLVRPRMLPVASRRWLESNSSAQLPNQLARGPLIHEQNHDDWRRWFEAMGVTGSLRLSGPRFWTAAGALEAARLGHGVALLPEPIAARDLAQGTLVTVVDSDIRLDSYTLAYDKRRAHDPGILRLRRWLKANLADDLSGKIY